MNADDFARHCLAEKNAMLEAYFDENTETQVAIEIRNLQLDEQQLAGLRRIVNGVLTDAFYTLLLGLDGAASIGGTQQIFELCDASGDRITGDGELEAAAYAYFQQS